MRTSVLSLNAFDDINKAYELMQRYGMWVLPVTDSDGILLGIVQGTTFLKRLHSKLQKSFTKAQEWHR